MNANEQQWQQANLKQWISSNEVHVWRAFLDIKVFQQKNLLAILSADEVEKASKFHFDRDKKRFIAARGFLRQILGGYLGKNPHQLRFKYYAHGKPALATDSGSNDLRFNLSHSDEIALYAVTRGRDIGIDIEQVREDVFVEQIANSFFSPCEISSLERTPKNKRTEMFFQYWTRKEAFLKATGKGLTYPMDQLEVSSINGRALLPIILPYSEGEIPHWYIQDLFPGLGYVASIVIEGSDCSISCRHFSI